MKNNVLHPKLICPHCAARRHQMYCSYNGKDIICRKCGRRIPIEKLRCCLEKAHKPDVFNVRKGYNKYFCPSVREQIEQEKRISETKGQKPGYFPPDLTAEKVKTTKSYNYKKKDIEEFFTL